MAVNGKDITIYDIAKKLNISAATVSRGLQDNPRVNKQTKKLIVKTAEEMGYHFNSFASNLRKKQSKIIGVIVPRLNSSFMSDVIAGIEKVVNNANYSLFISQSLESMKREISNTEAMLNNRVEGVLVSLAYDTVNTNHFKEFVKRKTPVIFFDRVAELDNCPLINIDNFKAAYEVTSHLIDQGCKRIVHISGNQLRNVYKDRFEGYKKALEVKGMPYDEGLVIINDLSLTAGEAAAEQILAMENLPDGVFSANDMCAISCMLKVKAAGIKVPEQIAFAGFNNDPNTCIVEPNLTTVNYKGHEMGEVAAKMMINYLNDKNMDQPAHTIILRSELLIRASSSKK